MTRRLRNVGLPGPAGDGPPKAPWIPCGWLKPCGCGNYTHPSKPGITTYYCSMGHYLDD